MKPRVLIGCECSGVVRRAFDALGWDAWSCDLQPTDDGHPNHFQCDVFEVWNDDWLLKIGHPTCTYLANSQVWRCTRDPERMKLAVDGANFFKRMWEAPGKYMCLENPIMHRYAREVIAPRFENPPTIQPWMFGHTEQKATCLWLRNLPPLVPTNDVYDEMMKLPERERQKVFYMSPGPNRTKARSKTFSGIAAAMATQWTAHILK